MRRVQTNDRSWRKHRSAGNVSAGSERIGFFQRLEERKARRPRTPRFAFQQIQVCAAQQLYAPRPQPRPARGAGSRVSLLAREAFFVVGLRNRQIRRGIDIRLVVFAGEACALH